MKKVLFLMSMSCGLAATVVAGDTFYWKANRRQWASYSDPANWSLEKDSNSNPDSRIPTSTDTLWYFGDAASPSTDYGNYLGYFNLGGGNYTIAGYSYGSGMGTVWKSYQIHLTNGTFIVLDPESHADSGGSARNTRGYHVWDSAKLVFPADGQAVIGVSGLEEQFSIKRGGLMEWYKSVLLYSMAASVENGGEMIFDPEVFDVSAAAQNTTQGHYCRLTNRGILRLPHGLVWAGSTTGNNQGKSFVLSQSTGTLYIRRRFHQDNGEQLSGGLHALHLFRRHDRRHEFRGVPQRNIQLGAGGFPVHAQQRVRHGGGVRGFRPGHAAF